MRPAKQFNSVLFPAPKYHVHEPINVPDPPMMATTCPEDTDPFMSDKSDLETAFLPFPIVTEYETLCQDNVFTGLESMGITVERLIVFFQQKTKFYNENHCFKIDFFY